MRKLKKLNLEELKKTMPVIGEIDQRKYIGGTDPIYTMDQVDAMIDNGTWQGGEVEGWGYMGPASVIFSGSGTNISLTEFSSGIAMNGTPDRIADMVIGSIPVMGPWFDSIAQGLTNAKVNMLTTALSQGYTGDSEVFFGVVNVSSGVKFNLYDANTGNLIYSQTTNVIGF